MRAGKKAENQAALLMGMENFRCDNKSFRAIMVRLRQVTTRAYGAHFEAQWNAIESLVAAEARGLRLQNDATLLCQAKKRIKIKQAPGQLA